jgi:hypothetical protein
MQMPSPRASISSPWCTTPQLDDAAVTIGSAGRGARRAGPCPPIVVRDVGIHTAIELAQPVVGQCDRATGESLHGATRRLFQAESAGYLKRLW